MASLEKKQTIAVVQADIGRITAESFFIIVCRLIGCMAVLLQMLCP